jgi:UDP-glucose 4-epimerase
MVINTSQKNAIIAVTGGRGFIGSHLLRSLEKTGISYTSFKEDLLDLESVKRFFRTNSIRQVVHLAGSFYGSFDQLVRKNVITTQHLLEAGTEFGLEKIIYVSTGAVYGEPKGEASLESDPCQPNTIYGLTKKMAEDVILYYQLMRGIKYVILRMTSVYGPGNRKGVLYNFLKDIQTKGSITIAGDGSQARDFLHVSDACNAIIKSINYEENDIFNISSPVHTSINDIVALLKQNYSFDIHYKEPDNFLKNLFLKSLKAETVLQFKPNVNDLSPYIQNFSCLETK